jgi:hypothetical protein
MKALIAALLLSWYACAGTAGEPGGPASLDSMVAAENRFAARCQAAGIRESFLEFFADSAIVFAPEPTLYRRLMAGRPLPANPLARSLAWVPVAGGIAHSGDFGFLTGPSEYTDLAAEHPAPSWGWYLSVWKWREHDGWKVILDVGTDCAASTARFFGAAFQTLSPRPRGEETRRSFLMDLDRGCALRIEAQGARRAYDALLAPGARGLFEGIGTVSNRDSLLALLAGASGMASLSPMGAEIASSGDLGYTYGAYHPSGEHAIILGYYVRIWTLDPAGWKILVEKTLPLAGSK